MHSFGTEAMHVAGSRMEMPVSLCLSSLSLSISSLSVSPLSLSLDLFLVYSSGPAIDYEISEINDLIYSFDMFQ